jgi:uncharacterized protein (DUF2062 family)
MIGSARARRWLDRLLHTHDTPRRTAAAFAVGVFFGFSPFLGLHTILGLVVAFAFGLNRVAVLLGVYANLPWIVPAYYSVATVLGAAILGVDVPSDLLRDFRDSLAPSSWRELRTLAHSLTPLLWAFVLGSIIGAVGLSMAAYYASLATIVAHRRRVEGQQERQPADE